MSINGIGGMGGIDGGRIQAMIAQMKAAVSTGATGTDGPAALSAAASGTVAATQDADASSKVSFSDMLKNSLDGVAAADNQAATLGKKFAAGDDSVSLSDVMIAGQKASIQFQASIQVRNKMVAAYTSIMNMQV